MCGISGFTFEDKNLIKKMMKTQAHRGPDQSGTYADRHITLGHNRLSILDLSDKGRQPMHSADGDIIIIFNGEIYNFRELKEELMAKGHKFNSASDTEVIIYSYRQWGVNCLEKFNGAFAFVLYDKRKRMLFLARDRLGKKPLYYWLNPSTGDVSFASELKALLCGGMPREIDDKALAAFLSLRYNPYNQTILKGIKKLPPAHYAIIELSKKPSMKIYRYWSLFNKKADIYNEDAAVEKLYDLLLDSTKKRLIADVPVGVYLSGGIDSSTVCAFMRKAIGPEGSLQTYSVGFNEESDEIKFANTVANTLNAEHTELILDTSSIKHYPSIVWHTDEPIADPALIPVYLLSKEAKRTSTVVLTGDGADELFAGYEQYKYLTVAAKINKVIPARILGKVVRTALNTLPSSALLTFFKYSKSIGEKGRQRAWMLFNDIENKPEAYLDFVSIFSSNEIKSISPNLDTSLLGSYLNHYFRTKEPALNQLLRLEVENVLVENFLMKNDKMTLAHAIEGRMPFLDHRIAELAFSLHPSMKLKGLNEKWIVRRVARGLLPQKILKRKKQRFYVPVDKWIARDKTVKQFVFDHLDKQLFSYDETSKIFKNYKSAPLYYGRQVWSLFTFLLWKEIYINKAKPAKLL